MHGKLFKLFGTKGSMVLMQTKAEDFINQKKEKKNMKRAEEMNVAEYLQKEFGLGEEEAIEKEREIRLIFGRQKVAEAVYYYTGADIDSNGSVSLEHLDDVADAFDDVRTGEDELNILVEYGLIKKEK